MKQQYALAILAVMLMAPALAQTKRDITGNMQQNMYQHQNTQAVTNSTPAGNNSPMQTTSQPFSTYNTNSATLQTNSGSPMANADVQHFDAGVNNSNNATGQYGGAARFIRVEATNTEYDLLQMIHALKVRGMISREITARYAAPLKKTNSMAKPGKIAVDKNKAYFYHAGTAKIIRNKNLEFRCQHRFVMFASWIEPKWGWSSRYHCFYYAYGHLKYYVGCHSVERGYWIKYKKNDKMWMHYVHARTSYECGAGEHPMWY